jgi:hypothetical protein
MVSLEAKALEQFRTLAAIPDTCRLERRLIQERLCMTVDCPSPAMADRLWRNQYQLVDLLRELALAERYVILCKGRVWHPSFRDL